MSKHTSGPWKVHPSPRPNVRGLTVFQGKADDLPIATVHLGAATHQTQEANANLIAASPDLLEALNYLLEMTVDQDLKYGIELTEGEEDAREKALAVIAKAKGES